MGWRFAKAQTDSRRHELKNGTWMSQGGLGSRAQQIMLTGSRLRQCGLPEPGLWHNCFTFGVTRATQRDSSSAAATAFSLSRNHVFRGFTRVNPFHRFLTFETGFLGVLSHQNCFLVLTESFIMRFLLRNLLSVFGSFHWQVCVSQA